ncbi:helix-turn-helix transcriptional regulator [Streptomyces sp. NPDC047070]|uniref:helix-turn-helix domain-containing protein n=1 Tax=Streptomyces sp. NPDC047070 TaxID=3154923 RepID=UPI00345669B0
MGAVADPAPDANVALLRRARGWSHPKLARRANVSHALLSKVEIGDRPLTPAVAAALGKALGVTMADVLVPASVAADDEQLLDVLRSAIRAFDLPDHQAVPGEQVSAGIEAADRHRRAVDVTALMPILAPLLRDATTHAHTANTAGAWSALADVHSTVYWLAARHRWTDIVELAIIHQRWAAEQQPGPLAIAIAVAVAVAVADSLRSKAARQLE